MTLTLTPLHPVFVAECSGVDIGQSISPETAAAIESAMDRYAVLVFRRVTPLTTEQQIAFTKSFGELEVPYASILASGGARLDNEALVDISNLTSDNMIQERDDRKRLSNLGNRLWHSDSSFKSVPAKYSALCAHVIPPIGGDTEFADMRAAWDTLDPVLKAQIENLVVEHSRIFSKGTLGVPYTEQERQKSPSVRQPLVRTNARSGRHSLFLSSHAGRIVGWPMPEALMLLRDLTEHATQREFVYRHKWQVGDLVMWDNGATMHRARSYEDCKYPRDLRRTTLTNGVPVLAMAQAAN